MIKAKHIMIAKGKEGENRWYIDLAINREGFFRRPATIYTRRPYEDRRQKEIKRMKSSGMCLFCGDIDWRHLEEHHPDKEKMPAFTFTTCANCHKEAHPEKNGGVLTWE